MTTAETEAAEVRFLPPRDLPVPRCTDLGSVQVLKHGNRYLLTEERSGTLCAQIEMITVATNLDRMESVDLPEKVRAAFAKHLVPAAAS